MTQTLTSLYDSYDDAKMTVGDLEAAGIGRDQISLVANNTAGDAIVTTKEGNEAATGAEAGAAFGGILGGGAGLLAGLGLLAIPGVGPVVAAGWLVAAAAGAAGGAAVGGAGGGLIGAMTGNGIPEEDANIYAEGVRRGGTLVTARVESSLVPAAKAILQKHRLVDPRERGRLYRKSGWSHFDASAPAYTGAQLAAERRLYPSAMM
jgi:hypothetical protein